MSQRLPHVVEKGGVMGSTNLKHDFILECKKRLLAMKQEQLNRLRSTSSEFIKNQSERSNGGDEMDQSAAQSEEHQFLIAQDRLHSHLLEIEMALARIEAGTFGVCEETEEPIELERLLAIPWTRLSIEGAELREAVTKKFNVKKFPQKIAR